MAGRIVVIHDTRLAGPSPSGDLTLVRVNAQTPLSQLVQQINNIAFEYGDDIRVRIMCHGYEDKSGHVERQPELRHHDLFMRDGGRGFGTSRDHWGRPDVVLAHRQDYRNGSPCGGRDTTLHVLQPVRNYHLAHRLRKVGRQRPRMGRSRRAGGFATRAGAIGGFKSPQPRNGNVARANPLRMGTCPGGEIGRRKGLKIPFPATGVWVQVPPRAPLLRP